MRSEPVAWLRRTVCMRALTSCYSLRFSACSVALLSTLFVSVACDPAVDDEPLAGGTSTGELGTEGTGTSGSDGSESGDPQPSEPEVYEGAECFELSTYETDYGDEAQRLLDVCETPEPCSWLSLHCPEGGEALDCDVVSGVLAEPEQANNLTCLLEAWASGEDAVVSWTYTDAEFPGWARRSHTVWVVDGRWFHSTLHYVDLWGPFDGFHEIEPWSPEALEGCLAAEDDGERLACLANPRTRSIAEIFPAED